jgi:hypothetical protein
MTLPSSPLLAIFLATLRFSLLASLNPLRQGGTATLVPPMPLRNAARANMKVSLLLGSA